MIAHVLAFLIGVPIGIVVSNAVYRLLSEENNDDDDWLLPEENNDDDWLLPEEAEDEHEEP